MQQPTDDVTAVMHIFTAFDIAYQTVCDIHTKYQWALMSNLGPRYFWCAATTPWGHESTFYHYLRTVIERYRENVSKVCMKN